MSLLEQLASKWVFSVQPNTLFHTRKTKRQLRGSLGARLQRMQPNLEHFKVDCWGIITEVTVNQIISGLSAFSSQLNPEMSFHLQQLAGVFISGLCRRTQSPFRMIRIQAATTGHPRSMVADVQHFGRFIFTATASLPSFAVTIFAGADFVLQIYLFET